MILNGKTPNVKSSNKTHIFLKSKHNSTYVCAQPVRHFPKADAEAVGEPLFLTPYIEAGQLEATRLAAQLDLARLELEEKLKQGTKIQVGKLSIYQLTTVPFSVLDPDPNWIRIQDLCGSVFLIQIQIQKDKYSINLRQKV